MIMTSFLHSFVDSIFSVYLGPHQLIQTPQTFKGTVDLYERFLNTNISIFRSPTPHLVHRYHPVTCSPTLPSTQAAMCKSRRASNSLPLGELVDKILNSSLLNG